MKNDIIYTSCVSYLFSGIFILACGLLLRLTSIKRTDDYRTNPLATRGEGIFGGIICILISIFAIIQSIVCWLE